MTQRVFFVLFYIPQEERESTDSGRPCRVEKQLYMALDLGSLNSREHYPFFSSAVYDTLYLTVQLLAKFACILIFTSPKFDSVLKTQNTKTIANGSVKKA